MKTTQKNYDFQGLPASRIMSNFIRWKAMPFGYIERGPGIIWLLSIWARHQFGYRIAWLQIKHRKQYDRVVFILHRLRRLAARLMGRS